MFFLRSVFYFIIIFILSLSASFAFAQDKVTKAVEAKTKQVQFTANPDELIEGRYEQGEELIFQLRMQNYNFGDIFAVADAGGMLIDFDAFIEYLNFPISYNKESRSYKGWFIREENDFELNLSNIDLPQLTSGALQESLSANEVKFIDDILFVNSSLFEKLFGITFYFNFSRLTISMKSREALPFFERLARTSRNVGQFNRNDIIHPELKRGYGILSPQTLDIRFNSGYRDSNNKLNTNYGVLAARDIGLLHSNLFLSGFNDDLLSNSRLVFSKSSTEGDLLGILGATSFEFGDVQPVRQGTTSARSRGFKFSNANLFNTIDIQFTNLTGPIQVGWDVEVYRNNVLLNQDFDIQTGEYSFLDVPLLLGMNEFEIVKYGPQGQIEREYQNRLINKQLIEKQKFTYSVSLTESNKSFLGTENNIDSTFDAGYNLSADFRTTALGISTSLGVLSEFGGEQERNTVFARANGSLGNSILYSASGNINDDKGFNNNLSVRAYYKDLNIIANAGRSGIVDDKSSFVNNASLRLSSAIELGEELSLNYDAEYEYAKGKTFARNNATLRLGLKNKWANIYNSIIVFDEVRNGVLDERVYGSLGLNKSMGPIYARLNTNYDLTEGAEIRSYALDLSYPVSNKIKTSLAANYNNIDKSYSINSTLGYLTDKFGFYSRINYSSVSGWLLGLDFSFSLSGQPLIYGDVFQTSRRLTSAGSLSVRVFEDKNLNGVYELGEVLIPNVEVVLKQSNMRAKTDELGIAVFSGTPNGRVSDIVIDEGSLPSSFLKPLVDGVSIRFRKGYADSLDFPIALTTELEGTVSIDKNGVLDVAPRVPVILLDDKNNIVNKTVSEYDGYYYFNGLKSGIYKIAIEEGYRLKNNLKSIRPQEIVADVNLKDYIIKDITIHSKSELKGYMSIIGEFGSSSALNVFTKVHKNKLANQYSSLQSLKIDDKFYFVSYFGLSEAKAKNTCLSIQQLGLDCKVALKSYFSN